MSNSQRHAELDLGSILDSTTVKERNLDSILDSTTVKERNLSDARQYCESPYDTLSRLPPVHRWRHATALAAHGLPGTAVHLVH